MAGPIGDIGLNLYAWTCILGVPGAVIGVLGAKAWSEVSPAIPAIIIALLAMTVFFLLMTSCSDPGIIPRKSLFLATKGKIPPRYSQGAVTVSTTTVYNAGTMESQSQRNTRAHSYCTTCQIYRPPRASHCQYNSCLFFLSVNPKWII